MVDELETRYPAFDGLNLSFETREGILKHCSARNAARLVEAEPQGPGRRFIDGTQPSLEAQLVNLADAMAYNAHDIDDGVRSGLITLAQMADVPLFAHWQRQVLADHPQLASQPGRRLLFETLRRMLSAQMADLIAATREAIGAHAPADADAVRRLPPLVRFSPALQDAGHRTAAVPLQGAVPPPAGDADHGAGPHRPGRAVRRLPRRPSAMPADFATAPTAPAPWPTTSPA